MGAQQAFLRRHWRTIVAVGSLSFDALLICLTYVLAARLEPSPSAPDAPGPLHPGILALLLMVILGIYTALGVYRTSSQSSFYRQAYLAGKGFVYSVAVVLTVLFLFFESAVSRIVLLSFFAGYSVLYLSAWLAARALLRAARERGYGRWNTLAIGSDPYLENLLGRLARFPELGYDVVSVIAIPPNRNNSPYLHVESPVVEGIVKDKGIEMITFSTSQLNGTYEELEQLCRRHRVGMRVISPEADLLFSRAGLHDITGISIFTPERRRLDRGKRLLKRTFDVVVSAVSIILLTPVFLLVALATKIESPGPVFFSQKRSLSDDDVPFDFIKFRSMYPGADAYKETLIRQNGVDGALFKMRDDPRITKVGRFIRRYSIDELPQLFNVFIGDMSLVGPRPLPVSDFSRMSEDDALGGYFRQRATVKPGMTGVWQISGRSELGFREMVLLDLYYIENHSILYDIEILAQTFPVVFFGKGAY